MENLQGNISFEKYLDKCIKSLEEKLASQSAFIAQHFELNEQAIKKAEDSMTGRLEGMNEFRDQIKDERARYATKETVELLLRAYDTRIDKLDERIESLEKAKTFSEGKMWMVMFLFALVPTILAVISFFT